MEATEDTSRDVYAHFGLAAYFGQCLENTLCNILLIDAQAKGEITSAVEFDEREVRHQKKTMGTLIRELRTMMSLPTNTEEIIDVALDRRNFLNHHFFRQRAEEFMSEAGCHRMTQELEGIQAAIQKADLLIGQIILTLLELLGVTQETVEANFERLKAQSQAKT